MIPRRFREITVKLPSRWWRRLITKEIKVHVEIFPNDYETAPHEEVILHGKHPFVIRYYPFNTNKS